MRMKLLLYLVLCLSITATAQIDYDKYPEVTSTYLINDVHIQKSPQDSFGLGDILIKEGRIAQIARKIEASDAYIIEGDSAYVYPAFIAALSHAGVAKEDDKSEQPEVKFRGYPPNGVVGITPEVKASAIIKAEDSSIKKFRESGFGMAHVVPRGTLLPGQGSLVMLHGKAAEMLYQEDNSMYMQMKGSRGYYPATIIGVMSKWRELYRQAEYLDKHQASYKSNPKAKRPSKDKSLEALIPLTKKEMSLYVEAPKVKDIYKALTLQKELGYNLVLSNVKQGWSLADKYKAQNVKILLSPVLPKDESGKDGKGEKDKKDKKQKGKKGDAKDNVEKKRKEAIGDNDEPKADKKKDEKQKDAETLALEARKKASEKAYVSQAAVLDSLGIKFGFSFTEGKPSDIKKSLQRMIKAGLTQEAALAALTTFPAAILGVSADVGTLDQGKIANLFISTKPYFDEKSAIKYVFVEGHMSELEIKKESKAKADEKTKKMLGDWKYIVEGPGQNFTGITTISDDDGELSITVTDNDDPSQPMVARDIKIDDETLTFTIDIPMGDQDMPATLEITMDDESYSGTVSMEGMGTMPISGTKASPELK